MSMFRGTVTVVPMPVENDSAEFTNIREHGADGTIPQAHGGSEAASWSGDSHYECETLHAGRKNGTFAPEVVTRSKKKDLMRGHIFERAVAEMCVLRMNENPHGIEVILHDASKEEWRNDAWPWAAAHLDFFVEVVRGKAIPNPKFVIGGPEPNFVLVPDNENHIYIADSKTVKSNFGSNWALKDENGMPVDGMKYGISPTPYRMQMLFYMAVCHIDGAFLFASCGFGDYDYAEVLVPYDKDEAEAMMDSIEAMNKAAYNGQIPKIADCKDVRLAISQLPIMYPDVNKGKKILELTDPKWKASFDRIKEIEEKLKELDSTIKPYADEFKKKVKDELGISVSFSLNYKDAKELKDEKSDILMLPLEDVKDGPACFFADEETGDVYMIEYPAGIKWDAKTKAVITEDYPEIAEDLRHRFPERKPKLSVNSVDKSKLKKNSRKR